MFLFRTVLVPFCLRVAVEVNRPCLGRHPISQRAAALNTNDGVVVVVGLAVVDGQAVVEAAGGREELRSRVPEMPWPQTSQLTLHQKPQPQPMLRVDAHLPTTAET